MWMVVLSTCSADCLYVGVLHRAIVEAQNTAKGADVASAFVFRIVIGSLFIAEYFIGLDGHGRAAGRPMTLLFGAVFVIYGVYGYFQRAALQRRRMAASVTRTESVQPLEHP